MFGFLNNITPAFLAGTYGMDVTTDILSSLIALVIPIIVVAIAGYVSEHSGIVNLALEGMMVIGAMAGCLVISAFNTSTGDCKINPTMAVILAMLVAMIAGGLASLLLAFPSINLKANQTIIGTAINIFAAAFVIIMVRVVRGEGGQLAVSSTINLPNWIKIGHGGSNAPFYTLPLAENASVADKWGYFFSALMFKNFYVTTIFAVIFIVAVAIMMNKTSLGLRIRACGENPQAVDSVGVSVTKIRYIGVIISGLLAGLGGFALCLNLGYTGSVLGFGFLSLAVMIFGNWKVGTIIAAGFIFAGLRVLSNNTNLIQSIFPGSTSAVTYAFSVIPYIVTIIILMFKSKNNNCPKAEGIPYDKGAR